MTYATRSSFPDPWLAVDGNVSATEALAVLGVVVWIVGLVWLVVSDLLRSRSKHHDHHGQYGDSDGRSRLRPR